MGNSKVRVFKFGGASVRSAEGVKNLVAIINEYRGPLIVVVSAMGKVTNLLERILKNYIEKNDALWQDFEELRQFHLNIVDNLFSKKENTCKQKAEKFLVDVETLLKSQPKGDFNYSYDQLVCYGELLSTTIIADYAESVGVDSRWIDIRTALRSDETYREGNIDFDVSQRLSTKIFNYTASSPRVYITQGFIAGTSKGTTTTLGREGSDYTAAILANLLNASDVTIWKDVEGVLNADPRTFANTIKLNRVSFKEAIELAYCGAQIIHPKTIKPLQNKSIKLYVKSFLKPFAEGTLVYQTDSAIIYPPLLIQKTNQVLISLTPLDFSFVIEDCLSRIFGILFRNRVKVNLVQSSAISFSICVDDEEHFLPGAIDELNHDFAVRYNKGLELLTIRHFTNEVILEHTKGKNIYLEQKTRSTIRLVLAN
ncbi:MAG: aspartate kinase [Bacteroidales bacterium]|nr:aspartate kinase [Bacteroidales bacterium]MDY0196641.1 aspartate kinase [Tenuifilaceae bacterium]